MSYVKISDKYIELFVNNDKWFVYKKTCYNTEWLLEDLLLNMEAMLDSHSNIKPLFLEKTAPYYLLFWGDFFINIKNILIDYNKMKKTKYPLPFLIEFIKNKLNIKLNYRKNIYIKSIKKNLLLSNITPLPDFLRQTAKKTILKYSGIHKEIISWKLYGNKETTENIREYVYNELVAYKEKIWIWKK